MRPSPQKSGGKKAEKLFIWILALSRNGCDAPVIWWGRDLVICFFPPTFFIFVCLSFVAVSVWLASVWLIISCDYSDWMTAITMKADRPLWLYGPYLYDYHLYYWLTVWMSGHISVCLAIRVCTTYKAFFFLFITQIILIVFFSGQINHIYDV